MRNFTFLIGSIYKDKGELDEAVKFLKESLTLAKQIGDLQRQTRKLDIIGVICREKGKLEEAKKYFVPDQKLKK